MERIKPRTLSGFMELLPARQTQFERMLETLRTTYALYGFTPLDTPVIESAEILLAKGGGETEKQIYRFTKGDSDLALRFDLTVPLAKYVALHYGDLAFPFRRYQIGKVYRGERAQRGRFREFYQADIDIIGDGKLDITNEAEIPSIIYQTFSTLGLKRFQIRVNNRKILTGFYEMQGLSAQSGEIMRTVDKLDKIGMDGVEAELTEKGFAKEAITKFTQFLEKNDFSLDSLKDMLEDKEPAESLEKIMTTVKALSAGAYDVVFDLSLVRGQGYYTGTVFEVESIDFKGAIAGGGRYDNLIGKFLNQSIPAVGFSIGFERIFSILMQNGIEIPDGSKKIAVLYEDGHLTEAVKTAEKLRSEGMIASLYIKPKKTGKFLSKLEERGYAGFYNVEQAEEVSYFGA